MGMFHPLWLVLFLVCRGWIHVDDDELDLCGVDLLNLPESQGATTGLLLDPLGPWYAGGYLEPTLPREWKHSDPRQNDQHLRLFRHHVHRY